MGEKIEIYCDGGARGNPGPAASAFVITVDGKLIYSSSKYLGETTNNVAEYSAVNLAYEWLMKNKDLVGNKDLLFILDSELVVKQLIGKYKVKKDHLKALCDKVKIYQNDFLSVRYVHVLRNKNKLADRLVNEALDRKK